MLRKLITDPHGRPMVPTYGSSKVKRYAYYETRKDLARLGDSPSLRFQRGHLEQHIIGHLEDLLNDEHALRRLSGIEEAGALRTMFATAHLLVLQLRQIGKAEQILRSLVAAITIRTEYIEVVLHPVPLAVESVTSLAWSIPLPAWRPFREARLRSDADASSSASSPDLINLIAEAMDAQRLVLASPELNLAQLSKREGRCRTQPKGFTRRALLICDMPIDWVEQERQFGLAA